MRTSTKVWLIIGVVLILAGGLLFGGVMSVLKWNFVKLVTDQYESNRYEITEKFSNLSVETETAEVVFALSDDGECRVECYEEQKAKHNVSVEGDTLVIRMDNQKAWYDYIGIHFGSPKITVYLPEDSFTSASGLIKAKTTTGSICVEHISVGSLDLTATTGKITVRDVTCEGDVKIKLTTGKTSLSGLECGSLASTGKTGDISLEHVVAAEKITIERATGDVRFDGSDAPEIYVETDTGKVTGSLLTGKEFITHTTTGRVNVPKNGAGGRCEIRTATGNIKIIIH